MAAQRKPQPQVDVAQPNAPQTHLALRFVRNFGLLLSGRGVSLLAALCFLALASRHFSLVDFGKIVLILAITSFLELGFGGALDSIIVREQAQNPEDGPQNFQSGLLPMLCFSALLLLLCCGIAFYFRHDAALFWGILISGTASALHLQLSLPVAFFRSIENMKFETTLVVFERCLFLVGFAAVVSFGGGVVAVVACLLFSMSLQVLVGYAVFLRRWRFRLGFQNASRIRYLLVEAAPLMAATFLFALRWRADLFFLRALGTDAQVGVYAASYRLMDLLKVLPVDIIGAAFPILCRLAGSDRRGAVRFYGALVKGGLLVGTLFGVLGAAYADVIVSILFGPSFGGSIRPLRILMLAYPLMFWSQVNNISLTAHRRQRWLSYSLVAGLLFQVLVDVLAIPRFGAPGAACGFVSGEVGFWIASVCAVVPLRLDLGRNASVAWRLLLAGVVAFSVGRFTPWCPILVRGTLALVSYLALVWLLRIVSGRQVAQLLEVLRQTRLPFSSKPGCRTGLVPK